MARAFPAILFLALSLSGPAAAAAELTQDLKERIERASPGERMRVIARFPQRLPLAGLSRREIVVGLRELAERSQGEIRRFLEAHGVRVEPLWIANALAVEAPVEVIRALAERPEIARLTPDRTWLLPQAAEAGPAEWNVAATGAPEAWARGIDGTGIVVAVLDTGVDGTHPDLASRFRGGANSWLDPFSQQERPADPEGHGTAAAGIIFGDSAGGTAVGMAPGAQWIACRVFDDTGRAATSAAHRCMQWVLDPDDDPDTDDAPLVVNNSWDLGNVGGTCEREFQDDLDALAAAGISSVFAAGNTGPELSTSTSPANNAGVIAVGAVDRDGQIAPFSARGPSACDDRPFPDLVAPGVSLRTTTTLTDGVGYARASGTSFSAPHVAGALALLYSWTPRPSRALAEEALLASATEASDPNDVLGHGALDVPAALRWLASVDAGSTAPETDAEAVPGRTGGGCGCSNAALLAGLIALGVLWASRVRPRREGPR